MEQHWGALEQCARRYVDNLSILLFSHLTSNGFYGNKDTAHIDSHKSVPFVDADLLKWFRV